mmetsp:Transcript_67689/g.113435  ORF Transcript_67689/g.113435 Transcript_67689/m.113435 type:complete len:218 (+) Transcript_67689:207-860(+)
MFHPNLQQLVQKAALDIFCGGLHDFVNVEFDERIFKRLLLICIHLLQLRAVCRQHAQTARLAICQLLLSERLERGGLQEIRRVLHNVFNDHIRKRPYFVFQFLRGHFERASHEHDLLLGSNHQFGVFEKCHLPICEDLGLQLHEGSFQRFVVHSPLVVPNVPEPLDFDDLSLQGRNNGEPAELHRVLLEKAGHKMDVSPPGYHYALLDPSDHGPSGR